MFFTPPPPKHTDSLKSTTRVQIRLREYSTPANEVQYPYKYVYNIKLMHHSTKTYIFLEGAQSKIFGFYDNDTLANTIS